MEQYSTIKKNEVLIHATAWINLETIVSEIGQLQKTTQYMIPLSKSQEQSNLQGQKVYQWLLGYLGWGVTDTGYQGTGFILRVMKMF